MCIIGEDICTPDELVTSPFPMKHIFIHGEDESQRNKNEMSMLLTGNAHVRRSTNSLCRLRVVDKPALVLDDLQIEYRVCVLFCLGKTVCALSYFPLEKPILLTFSRMATKILGTHSLFWALVYDRKRSSCSVLFSETKGVHKIHHHGLEDHVPLRLVHICSIQLLVNPLINEFNELLL